MPIGEWYSFPMPDRRTTSHGNVVNRPKRDRRKQAARRHATKKARR